MLLGRRSHSDLLISPVDWAQSAKLMQWLVRVVHTWPTLGQSDHRRSFHGFLNLLWKRLESHSLCVKRNVEAWTLLRESALGKEHWRQWRKERFSWVVQWFRTSPTNAGCMGSNLGWGGKIPHVDSAVRNKHTKAQEEMKTWLISLNS